MVQIFLQAKRAGDNAMKQMAIVVKSQQGRTPSVVLRCWLFVAMSAMQQGRLKDARQIIRWVYHTSRYGLSEVDRDTKIEKMCLGIWSRLRYAWKCNMPRLDTATSSTECN